MKASSLACIKEILAILETSSYPNEKPHTLAIESKEQVSVEQEDEGMNLIPFASAVLAFSLSCIAPSFS